MDARHIHESDQWVAGWKQHAFPLLRRVFDAVLDLTSDRAFAVDVTAWCNGGPAGVIASAKELEEYQDLVEFLERCATVEVCAVYSKWQEEFSDRDISRTLALAFLRSRFKLTRAPRHGTEADAEP